MLVRNLNCVLVMSMLCTTSALFAAEGARTTVELSDGVKVTGVKEIPKESSDDALELLGIIVGKSKLSDAQLRFSGGEIFHQGDAGNSIYLLCYRGSDNTVLAFESSGEMGSPNHIVTAASVYSNDGSYLFKSHCAKSNLVNKEIKLSSGLHLGSSRADVKKIIGDPSKESPKFLLYSYSASKEKPTGKVNISSMLEIRLTKQRVSQFSLSKIEAY